MIMVSVSQITANAPDFILILISGLACMYCALLNRRLRNLNNLKTGVGASIVTLTEAIENTHKAAQQAQRSTLEAVATLKDLLETSESATPQIAGLVAELEQARENAKAQRQELENTIEISLAHAITRAQNTASGLLNIISDINESKEQLIKEREEADAKAEKLAAFEERMDNHITDLEIDAPILDDIEKPRLKAVS